jgi:hypothetical protein
MGGKLPKDHKMYQTAIKTPNDLNIFQNIPLQALQNITKVIFLHIFGMQIYSIWQPWPVPKNVPIQFKKIFCLRMPHEF